MNFSLGRTAGVTLLTTMFDDRAPRLGRRSGFGLLNRPISYARSCDAYGAGYFTVPGSGICLRLGGMAFSELDLRHVPLSAFAPNPGSA